MRTVTYRLADLEKKVSIHIGRLGENEVTRVQIDAGSLFAEYPAAVASMSVENPEGVKYPATVTRDGDMVIWDVRDSDLAKAGHGEIQWTFTENGAILKSAIARTSIGRSIVGDGEAPDPLEDWIEHAEDVLEQVDGAFPKGGSAGQVLAKKSGADYDTEWVNQGSGGTGDYEELENLPKIGGVELKGDKSLHDLGAAAETDIPDVSGFYTKPGSGIPASDLADGVIPDVSGFYTKPGSGIPASDLAAGVIPDVSGFYTKPSGGIPASDIADGVIPDPEDLIDDTAGEGDTDKTWSADKLTSDVLSAINTITPSEYSSSSTYAVGDLCWHENAMYRCNTAISTAEAWTVAHWTQIAFPRDVRVNGTTVVDANGVANVPIMSANDPGVAKVGDGLTIDNNTIKVESTSVQGCKNGTNSRYPVTPNVEHAATFYGLAKASGDTTQSSSSNAVGVYTEDAKLKIQQMLGLWTPKIYIKCTLDEEKNNFGDGNFPFNDTEINIYEEFVICIYQSDTTQTAFASNNFGYFTIRDAVNNAYINVGSMYLKGTKQCSIMRIKRLPNAIVAELINDENSTYVRAYPRSLDYVDKIRWINASVANGTFKAGTTIETYISRFY